jgi:hypothetical protein
MRTHRIMSGHQNNNLLEKMYDLRFMHLRMRGPGSFFRLPAYGWRLMAAVSSAWPAFSDLRRAPLVSQLEP